MSDLIYNFSQNANRGQLTQLGAMFSQAYQQRQAAKAEAERTAQYNGLLSQFMKTKDYSLWPQMQNVYPEKFKGFQEGWSSMDEAQRKQTIQNNAEILGHLDTGDWESATDKLLNIEKAYKNAGDEKQAKLYRALANEASNGNGDKVSALLAGMSSATPEGQAMLEARHAINQEQRSGEKHIADLVIGGSKLVYGSPEHQNWARIVANKIGGDLGQFIVDLGGIDTSTPKGKDDLQVKVNDKWYSRTGEWQSLRTSNLGIKDSYNAAVEADAKGTDGGVYVDPETGAEHQLTSGIADLAMINQFQRMIDPATVRESDILNIAKTSGMMDIATRLKNNILYGEKLTPQQRKQIVDMSEELFSNATDHIDNVVFPSLEAIQKQNGLDYTASFGDYIPKKNRTDPMQILKSDAETPREPTKKEKPVVMFPNTPYGQLQQQIADQWPEEAEHIKELSLEQLKTEYPKTLQQVDPTGQLINSFSTPSAATGEWEDFD